MNNVTKYFQRNLALRSSRRKNTDIGLFFLFTVLFAFLLFGNLSLGNNGFVYSPSEPKSIGFFLLVFVPFLLLGSYLFLEFYLAGDMKINKVSIVLLLVFLIYRLAAYSLFPVGNVVFNYRFEGESYAVSYPGLSLYSRILSFLEEAGFGFYFFFLFNAFPYLSMGKKIRDFFCYFWMLFAFVLVVSSLFLDGEGLIHNIHAYIHPEMGMNMDICSFTNQRNVFGFFLLIGAFASMIEFFIKGKWYFLLPYFLYTVFSILIVSKTPMLILIGFLFFLGILYPIFFFKKHRAFSILFLSISTVMIVFLIAILFYPKESAFCNCWLKPLNHMIFNHMLTVDSRKRLTGCALEMLFASPSRFFFGYGRVAFQSVFFLFKKTIGNNMEVDLPSSHNAYVETWEEIGFLGFLLSLFLLLLVFYKAIQRIRKKDYIFVVYLMELIAFLVYGMMEMRILFGTDYSQAIEMTCFLFPFLIDYQESRKKETASSPI